ncbi:MAG: hypothetical protein KAS65_04440 [Candidatus Aminicenantes bacterium]|nr:hypothetical protein [Candidatus Aminicenantes bacterium]
MPPITPEFQLGKRIIGNLIRKAFEKDQGFYHSYESPTLQKRGGLNDNDLGDYLPFLHYFDYIEVALNYLKTLFSRYDLFYIQKDRRFGSTRLSQLGIIDLFSNSDFFHGILFARQQPDYRQFHDEIDGRIERLIQIISKTRYSHFVKLGKYFIPFPVFRIIDLSMFPEIILGFGKEAEAKHILSRFIPVILKRQKPFYRQYLFGLPLGKNSCLMKDHTNLLFSCIRYYRTNPDDFDPDSLKELIRILSREFTSDNIVFNQKSDLGGKASSLAFAFLEVLLESYLLTEDKFYLGELEKLLSYWLTVLDRFDIFPTYMNTLNNQRSNKASVDPNTDFYVFFKKMNLFLGETFLSGNLLKRFRENLMESFVNPETHDVYSWINLDSGEKSSRIKCKFSSLFTKIMITDGLIDQRDYQNKEIYLDDR